MPNVADYVDLVNRLRTDADTWRDHWEDCAMYIVPRKKRFETSFSSGGRFGGQRRTSGVYDSTAIQANELFAATVHGMMISYDSHWFKMESSRDDLNKLANVSAWYDEVTDRMHSAVHHAEANFTSAFDEVLLDIGAFGTATMIVEEGDNTVPARFDSWSLAETTAAESAFGRVDIVVREYYRTARQLEEKYGLDNLHPNVRRMLQSGASGRLEEYRIAHLIMPRPEYESGLLYSKKMPYASVHIDMTNMYIMRESGFNEFPAQVGRWRKESNETYGRGPGMVALPDIKMLNAVRKASIIAKEKALDPPLQAPSDGYLGKIKTYAGALNFYNRLAPNERIEPLLEVGNINAADEEIAALKESIRAAFYNDQLQLVGGPDMTAFEVSARLNKQLRLMSPMLGRIQSEILSRALDREFLIMLRSGKFPPLPDELKGSETNTRYKNQLAQAQAETDVDAITQTIGLAMQLAQVDPTVMDNFDLNEAAKIIARVKGYPPEALRSEDLIAQIQQNRAQAQQAQNEKQDVMDAAEVSSKVAAGRGAPPMLTQAANAA